MTYTFEPNERYARALGSNMRISTKNAVIICRVIRNKKLKVVKKLLEDLSAGRRDLDGRYYTKTVTEILQLLKSCEKNADFKNLDHGKLFVHASAHQGSVFRRRRRKAAFGSRMKTTNMEMFLIERGSGAGKAASPAKKTKETKSGKVSHEVTHGEGSA